ncbi:MULTISPECIES: dihydrodipicolinate reductase C-terminal domain-containing protein [Arthrobacter]|uniref:NAD-dependent epimerase/dehydratase family protein n=1 Tax=Arthrobacter terricola TaxID=2547396 RepID=A0A4R5K735_9MICC|nr:MULTISPECIES: dihydrodipicolinate reductase C-terminal domain-containing protein [Arthrobacter]MBT8163496.1 NAD-dependent epimerase/dehydratase family protein [Arthrobacter sp. GN70]TDF89459.1 NAD-dependent epimerase/dehydratase family protein [Arthrobacter terricola]
MAGDTSVLAAVVGHRGRLGSALCRALEESRHTLVGRVDRDGAHLNRVPNLVFDASNVSAIDTTLRVCRQGGAALIYCVSALSDAASKQLEDYAMTAPVVIATNLTLGHWLQAELVRNLAKMSRLSVQAATAIHERHPRTKLDRPSASAADLRAVWEAAGGNHLTEVVSLRFGLPVSGHTVTVDLPGESLSIHHEVASLDSAGMGAVVLSDWIIDQAPGLYDIHSAFEQAFRRISK